MKNEWKHVLKKLPWLILLPIGLLWPTVLAGHTDWVERVYAGCIYPAIKDALSAVTSAVPFSLAELCLYGLIAGVAALLLTALFRLLSRRVRLSWVVSEVLSLLILCGVLLNWFYISWGGNYFRRPLYERMGLTVEKRPVAELNEMVRDLADTADFLRDSLQVAEDENGVFTLPEGTQSMMDHLPEAYGKLSAVYPLFSGKVTRAKGVLWSEKLSRRGVAGIYVGMTAEPNINVAQTDLLLPQAAAHEMAHQLGVASENEAEFTAYLACLSSDDPAVRYSGVMYALIVCGNALHDVDDALYQQVRSGYSDAMERDLAAYKAYWDAYDGAEQERADAQNDFYLKYNAQESGVKSYGEAVDLLLAYYNLTKS